MGTLPVSATGGYAGLIIAIALKACLEYVMITGHGKCYGYSPLKPGERVPTMQPRQPRLECSMHRWRTMETARCMLGAGNVGNQVYNKEFTLSYFRISNDDFGIKHFPNPADDAYFFRSDGGVQSWKQYMIGPVGAEPLQLYGAIEDHGLSGTSFLSLYRHISVNSGEVMRFQFSKACEH
jgi:hypothetical protein